MAIILNIINQQSRHLKLPEPLDITTHRPILHHHITQIRFLEHCIEDGSPALRMAHQYEVLVVADRSQDFF